MSGWRRALARAVLASAQLPGALTSVSRVAINGFWLGLLSDTALRAVDERYYAGESVYRTDGWNENGLFAWEQELIDEHFAGRERVLVVGCGGGREVLALLESGFDASGYEPHPALARYADEFLAARGHGGRAHHSPRDRFPLGAPPADAAVVGWGAYSLIHGRERRVGFLADARRLLSPGAPLLLSFFAREVHGRELRYTAAAANGWRRLRGRPALDLGDTLGPNLLHVFTRAQLAGELTAAGCELASYGVIAPADGSTKYAAAVARVR